MPRSRRDQPTAENRERYARGHAFPTKAIEAMVAKRRAADAARAAEIRQREAEAVQRREQIDADARVQLYRRERERNAQRIAAVIADARQTLNALYEHLPDGHRGTIA